jgi:hypothetical protein
MPPAYTHAAAGPSTGELCRRLVDFDDLGGEHLARVGSEVQRVVGRYGDIVTRITVAVPEDRDQARWHALFETLRTRRA